MDERPESDAARRAATDRAASLQALFGARGVPAATPPSAPPPAPAPSTRRRRFWLIPVVVVALLAVAGLGVVVSRGHETPVSAAASPSVPASETALPSPSVAASPSTSPSEEPSARPSTVVPSPTMSGKPNSAGVDLALHKRVTASGEEGPNYAAIYAVDGDPATRWSSAFLDPQWIKVDLGAVWRVSDVRLDWERAYATAYRVDVSVDGKTWATIYQTSSGAGGNDDLRIRVVPARYVRMYGLHRVSQYGYSLLALRVF